MKTETPPKVVGATLPLKSSGTFHARNGFCVRLVPRISTQDPEAKFVVVPQPSEALASVIEPGGVSAANNELARPLSKIEPALGACASALAATNENKAIRRDQLIRFTAGLDLRRRRPRTDDFRRRCDQL